MKRRSLARRAAGALLALAWLAVGACHRGPDVAADAGAVREADRPDANAALVLPPSSKAGTQTVIAVPPEPLDAPGWRARADALARVHDMDGAAAGYASCAVAAGDDFETSLYCQAALAATKKIRLRHDGGMPGRSVP